jgi:hypothetical protein
MPDDLPHPGNVDLVRAKRWFDAAGNSALAELTNHFPAHNANQGADLRAWFGSNDLIVAVIGRTRLRSFGSNSGVIEIAAEI